MSLIIRPSYYLPMLSVTKIFYFDSAHAIKGHNGECKHIHGHTYELHVTVTNCSNGDHFIPWPGMIIDFKELKKIVSAAVLKNFDHRLLLSEDYLKSKKALSFHESLFALEAEPTAENLLICIRAQIEKELPEGVKLVALKLYETNSSYAEWINTSLIGNCIPQNFLP